MAVIARYSSGYALVHVFSAVVLAIFTAYVKETSRAPIKHPWRHPAAFLLVDMVILEHQQAVLVVLEVRVPSDLPAAVGDEEMGRQPELKMANGAPGLRPHGQSVWIGTTCTPSGRVYA